MTFAKRVIFTLALSAAATLQAAPITNIEELKLSPAKIEAPVFLKQQPVISDGKLIIPQTVAANTDGKITLMPGAAFTAAITGRLKAEGITAEVAKTASGADAISLEAPYTFAAARGYSPLNNTGFSAYTDEPMSVEEHLKETARVLNLSLAGIKPASVLPETYVSTYIPAKEVFKNAPAEFEDMYYLQILCVKK